MLIHLIPLVQAASWLSTIVPKSNKVHQHRFNEFVSCMEGAESIDNNPLTTWLVPDWLKYLDNLEVPLQEPPIAINDSEFGLFLEKLRNPTLDIAEKYKDAVSPITMHSQEIAKKIVACLAHAQITGMNWQKGLKEHAHRLANNLAIFPAWLDEAQLTLFQAAIQCASMFDLSGPNPYFSWVNFLTAMQATYHGRNQGGEVSEVEQMKNATNLVLMLKSNPSIVPGKIHGLISLLNGIWRSALLKENEKEMYLRMIPIGRRFAMGTVSKAKFAAILDMIKADDGFVYGIKYSPIGTLHPPALAFSLPHGKLPALLDFLKGPYSSLNGIDKISEVRCRSVNLKWYSGKDTVLGIVRQIAHAWNSDEHLRLGMILFYCKSLLELNKGHVHSDMLEHKQFLLELIDQITIEHASHLVSAIKKLNRPAVPPDDDTAIRAQELFDVIMRALIARV